MIVGLAHTFGVEVIAGGVETEEQAAPLEEIGCDMAQSYLYSRPVTAEGRRTCSMPSTIPERPHACATIARMVTW